MIELKEEYELGEAPGQTFKQTIVYGAFLRKLLRSVTARAEDMYDKMTDRFPEAKFVVMDAGNKMAWIEERTH